MNMSLTIGKTPIRSKMGKKSGKKIINNFDNSCFDAFLVV